MALSGPTLALGVTQVLVGPYSHLTNFNIVLHDMSGSGLRHLSHTTGHTAGPGEKNRPRPFLLFDAAQQCPLTPC